MVTHMTTAASGILATLLSFATESQADAASAGAGPETNARAAAFAQADRQFQPAWR